VFLLGTNAYLKWLYRHIYGSTREKTIFILEVQEQTKPSQVMNDRKEVTILDNITTANFVQPSKYY